MNELAWPLERLGEVVEALARQAGLVTRPRAAIATAPEGLDRRPEGPGPWIEAVAEWHGCEAEPLTLSRGALVDVLARPEPCLLRLSAEGPPLFVALLAGGARHVKVLAPDHSQRRLDRAGVEDLVLEGVESALGEPLEAALERAGVGEERRGRARRAVVRERLGLAPVGQAWLLQPAPGAGFWHHAWRVGLPLRVLGFGVLEALHYGLFLLSWWLVGRGALEGRLEVGWLLAWALLLLTLVPLRLLATWWQGRIALSAGRLLRQRLLYGALRLDPEEIRHKGAGQLLGSVLESEAVEQLAVQGGFAGLVALVELSLAGVVLAWGAAGPGHALLLVAWLALGLLVGARHLRQRRLWTEARVQMTDSLVERMVGHRTVLAQEAPGEWADERDIEVDGYLRRSQALDRTMTQLQALLSRGFLVVGLAALAPALVAGSASRASLAVSIGAVLLASRSLRRLASSAAQLTGAAVAWSAVAGFFHAAGREAAVGAPRSEPAREDRGVAVEASELVFRYPDREEAVLSSCELRIQPGERVLLEGESGGGKSTLAALLMGLRDPQAGLLLLDGLDRATLGERSWRRRVAGAPQFHENHILSDTLAFNLLMGHRWPPAPGDFDEAEALCRELGLGPLLERMPAGLLQIVGDTGWQLSHGERSRVFIARALLQNPALLVLDESFGALDPETLTTAMDCVRQRARGLVVIAHP